MQQGQNDVEREDIIVPWNNSRIWFAIAFVVAGPGHCRADHQAEVEALKKIQELVGQFEGSGKSEQSKGWDEKIDCSWKFKKDGKPSLKLGFSSSKEKGAGRILEEGLFAFDAEKSNYVFKAYKAGDDSAAALVQFEGKPKSATNLILDRVDKGEAKDPFDRLDVKFLNEGDRVVYTFMRRVGTSKVYRQYAQVSLDRKGTSLAASAAAGPKCIITGGAATMQVSYNGKSYPVCCTGCREMFLAEPEKFLAKLKN